MADTEQTPFKCAFGGTPQFFGVNSIGNGKTYKYCECHPTFSTKCDGTERKSLCLLGCESCYLMIQAKKKREAEDTRRLQRELNEARRELVQTKTELAKVKKDLAETKGELLVARGELDRAKKELRMARGPRKLNKDGRYSQFFQSPIAMLILKNPEPRLPSIIYNVHIARLTQVSTYFQDRFNSRSIFGSDSNSQISVSLASTLICHPIPFKYFVAYLYSGTYEVPASQQDIACLIHVLVCLLASHLKTKELMDFALENVTAALQNTDGSWKIEKQNGKTGEIIKDAGRINDRVVVKMAEAAYTEDPSDDRQKDYDDETIVSSSGSAYASESGDEDASKEAKNQLREQATPGSEKKTDATDEEELAEAKQSLGLDEAGDSEDLAVSEPHPIRMLVSGFAATRLEALNKRSDFRALLARFPQFAVDMMIAKDALRKA